jgi:hypothetical protein
LIIFWSGLAISVAPRHSVDLRATAKGGQTIGEVKASGPEALALGAKESDFGSRHQILL